MPTVPILNHPLAAQFLNAFAVIPERGTITFPNWEGDTLRPAALTRGNVREAIKIAGSFLGRTNGFSKLNLEVPYPLPSTGYHWSLTRFSNPDDLGSFIEFRSDEGSRVEFSAFDYGWYDWSIGGCASDVDYEIVVGLKRDSRVVKTNLYTFSFIGRGLRHFRASLNEENSPLCELGFRVAGLIYASGQFQNEEIYLAFRDQDSHLRFDFEATAEGRIKMDLSDYNSLRSHSRFLISGKSTDETTEFEIGGEKDSLEITMVNPFQGLMPLCPDLKTGLWERAEQIRLPRLP